MKNPGHFLRNITPWASRGYNSSGFYQVDWYQQANTV